MSEQHTHKERYRRAREEFEELNIEDQALFLVEAAVSTLARGIEGAGRTLAQELDHLFHFHTRPRSGTAREHSGGPGAAEPATSAKTAPTPPKKDAANESGAPPSEPNE